MRAVVVVLSLVLVLASATSARAQEPELAKEIVVQVNGEIITRRDYQAALSYLREALKKEMKGKRDEEIEAEYEKQKPLVLDGMIDDLLLDQRARDLGMDFESEINQEFEEIAKSSGLKDRIEVELQMAKDGVDVQEARASLRRRMARQAVLEREVAHPLMRRGATAEEVDAAIKPYLKKLRDDAFIKFTNPSP